MYENKINNSKNINYEENFIEILKETDLTTSLKTKLLSMRDLEILAGSLRKELQLKIFNLEANYEKLYAELYSKREKIQTGDEISNLLEKKKIFDVENTENKEDNFKLNIEELGVPEFWATALGNIEFKLPFKINEKDRTILKYLKNITIETSEKGSFTINFIFEQNQYFQGTLLYKKFVLNENDFSISQLVSPEIKWTSKENNPFFILELGEEDNKETKNKACSKILFVLIIIFSRIREKKYYKTQERNIHSCGKFFFIF